MEECRYFKIDEEIGFFYQDLYIVSKHHDKQYQPIMSRDLQLKIFFKIEECHIMLCSTYRWFSI